MEPIHPLSLPEIVLPIGKAIPLWIPEQLFGETSWMLRPKDLVATISVNHLFHSVLTPLLWTVYYEPNEKMRKLALMKNCRGREYHGLYTQVDIDIVEKNSIFFRYLDVSGYRLLPRQRRVGKLQLQCQRLQELRVSPKVGVKWVSRLIKLNPNLQVLDWWREPIQVRTSNMLELQKLFPLRWLRYLGLQGWNLQSLFLCHILENNANNLDEMNLGYNTRFIDEPRMNDDWSGLRESSMAKMTKRQANKASKLIQAQRLLLPNSESAGALSTGVIKHPKLYQEFGDSQFRNIKGTIMLVDTCIPGDLTHLSITSELLKGLRCSRELESLIMIGFFGMEEEGSAMERENSEQEEREQQQQEQQQEQQWMRATRTTKDGTIVPESSFTMQPGWFETKGSFYTSVRPTIPLSSSFLKSRMLETMGHLPKLREVELNLDLFQKKVVAF
ncbi:MAG: hypothetical protein J3R72DRAFT_492348 [Linnemannia gamsii]|nr:MAG: hypothetical protein J3R72DRAFT_492348 [Linnemannia gamsii]